MTVRRTAVDYLEDIRQAAEFPSRSPCPDAYPPWYTGCHTGGSCVGPPPELCPGPCGPGVAPVEAGRRPVG